eukprot:768054-Hanusia_phi.AAC.2
MASRILVQAPLFALLNLWATATTTSSNDYNNIDRFQTLSKVESRISRQAKIDESLSRVLWYTTWQAQQLIQHSAPVANALDWKG